MHYEAAIDLQKQLAFITALLSGFSITFVIGLLQMEAKDKIRTINICLISGVFSACCLILSTIASMSGAFWMTERPHLYELKSTITNPEVNYAFDWAAISFVLGLIALLISIGFSGRLHSKRIGRLTLAFSLVTIILIFFFWTFLVPVN
ncbi:MAG: hypothetical protein P1U56_16005 [Saprospiraceae bacterium]|nr:hypothetical protein [Saprospiraceae bacterium]